jgi:hypothetical protein
MYKMTRMRWCFEAWNAHFAVEMVMSLDEPQGIDRLPTHPFWR